MEKHTSSEVPVLIVGGGPVGLCAALLLARHGVQSLVVERHPTTSRLPKARLVNTRTMEVFRQCGIESEVRAAGLPPSKGRYLIRARSVAGEELDRREATFTPGAQAPLSPTTVCTCPQNRLEPVVLAAVRDCGMTQVRFQHELTAFAQDGHGVTATIVDRGTGDERQVRAAYLLGADGAHSRVRQALGIPMLGKTGLSHNVFIHFRADLDRWFTDRPPYMVFIAGPEGPGPLLTVNGTDEWLYTAHYDPARGQRLEDFTAERSLAAVRAVIGMPDLPVELLGATPWTANALVAERYVVGRVVLAGDAAHETTPVGGFGMNTGIQDVHNLAWKLAAVLQGWAEPGLLTTYEAERRPVGQAVTDQSLRNLAVVERPGEPASSGPAGIQNAASGHRSPGGQQLLSEWGLIFGTAYSSAALVPDGTRPPEVIDPVTDYVPTARPGHRAPHVWLQRDGQRLSTLDLFDHGFVLLTGRAGDPWRRAGRHIAETIGLPLASYLVGPAGDTDDPSRSWGQIYGIDDTGAVLVRPDGHVAWRSRSGVPDPAAELRGVLAQVLAHGWTSAEIGPIPPSTPSATSV